MQTAIATTSRFPRVSEFAATVPGRILAGLTATVAVAAAAHVAIPLPFTPVPLTLQPLAVLGVGLALGPLDGFLAMLGYLAEGAMGLPVFAPTGIGGVAQIIGPTGGFLMAYPLVADVAGSVTRVLAARTSRFVAAAVGSTIAVALLFAVGAAWFAYLTHLPAAIVWTKTVAPFLPGEAVKIVIAAGVYSTLWRAQRIR
jgi:biotin transport system substrate-specific component